MSLLIPGSAAVDELVAILRDCYLPWLRTRTGLADLDLQALVFYAGAYIARHGGASAYQDARASQRAFKSFMVGLVMWVGARLCEDALLGREGR
jgi:hypothetical protein